MKKFTFILLLNLGICSCLMAQVSVGLKAGGALANHVYKGIGLTSGGNGDNLKLTYLGGLFVSVPISEKFIIQPEILYSDKGYRAGWTSLSGASTTYNRHNFHYISVPIMLQYRLLDKLTVELGPEIGYLLSASQNIEHMGSSPSDFPYKDLDIALNIGVGYSLSDRWNLNLRYNMGISDVSEDFTISVIGRDEPVLISNSTYNCSLQFSVGFRLF
ncbi:MAG: porin family protein [Cyclobacteriaceae bacterium]